MKNFMDNTIRKHHRLFRCKNWDNIEWNYFFDQNYNMLKNTTKMLAELSKMSDCRSETYEMEQHYLSIKIHLEAIEKQLARISTGPKDE